MCLKTVLLNLIIFLAGKISWNAIAGQKTGRITGRHVISCFAKGWMPKPLKKRLHVFLIIIIKNKQSILTYAWELNVMAVSTCTPILTSRVIFREEESSMYNSSASLPFLFY